MSICVFNFTLALLSCPFQTCLTEKSVSSCSIACELSDGQFPSLENQTIKSISEMVLKNVSYIPDDSFKDLEITDLSIDGSNLENISENAFRNNKKIKRLLMSGLKSPNVIPDNSLKYLENSTKSLLFNNNHLNSDTLNQHFNKFKLLKSLQYLNLRNNRLYRIYLDLSNFSNLNYLDLVNNSIFDIKITGNFTNLELSHNNMIELKKNMFTGLKFLNCLNLSYNLVEALETGIFSDLKQLNQLYLKNNRIKFIELDWIHSNNSVKMLDLSNNYIEKFSIKNFQNLKYLNLSKNKINFISDIRPEIKLLSIDISDNLFESIPFELIYSSQNIEFINLSRNKIKSLDFLRNANCSNLNYFDASHNLIELVFPQDFHKCTSLTSLILSSNRIRIMEFPYLEKLSLLDVQNNYLVYLNRATLINLPNLKKFYATNNKILVLDSSSFNNNSQLIELHLNRNYLAKIPNISKLFRLEFLNLENQNGMLSELNNFAFEKESSIKETSQFLAINIGKNNITKFENRIFCTRYQNVIDIKRITLIIDSIYFMNKCILKQLSLVETIIYANNDQECSLVQNKISKPDGHINIGCEIANLSSDCFDDRYRCHYLSDFGKKNFTSWLSGDMHLYSFESLYEACVLEKEILCFSLNELSIYCYFEQHGENYKMTKVRVVYASETKNYVYKADEKSFSRGFNDVYDRLKKFQVEFHFFPPNHRIILDKLKNIEISILRDKFYTILIRTTQENFKTATGILKTGCPNRFQIGEAKFRLIGANEKKNVFLIAKNLGLNYKSEKYFADLNDNREILLTTFRYNFTDYLKETAEIQNMTAIPNGFQETNSHQDFNLKIPISVIEKLNCTKIKIKKSNISLLSYDKNELMLLNDLNQNWKNVSNLKLLITENMEKECYLASQDNALLDLEENILKCFPIENDSREIFCLKSKKHENISTTEKIDSSVNYDLVETTPQSHLGNSRRSRPNFILQMIKPGSENSTDLNENITTNYPFLSFISDKINSTLDFTEKSDSTTKLISKTSFVFRERIVKNPVLTTYSSTSVYYCSSTNKIKYSKISLILLFIGKTKFYFNYHF